MKIVAKVFESKSPFDVPFYGAFTAFGIYGLCFHQATSPGGVIFGFLLTVLCAIKFNIAVRTLIRQRDERRESE